jgi:hypothetical protein
MRRPAELCQAPFMPAPARRWEDGGILENCKVFYLVFSTKSVILVGSPNSILSIACRLDEIFLVRAALRSTQSGWYFLGRQK